MVGRTGFEPGTSGATIQRSSQLSYLPEPAADYAELAGTCQDVERSYQIPGRRRGIFAEYSSHSFPNLARRAFSST